MRATIVPVVACIVMLGCGAPRAGGCRFNSECSAGHFCMAGTCMPGCSSDAECVASHGTGSVCSTFGVCSGSAMDAGSSVDASTMDASTHDSGSDGGVDAAADDAASAVDAAPDDVGVDAGAADAGNDAAAPDAGSDAATPVDAFVSGASLLFSEYIEGSSNNKALEIANVGTSTADLSTCLLHEYANGGTTPQATYMLTGTLAPHAVITLCNSSATAFAPASCTASLAGGVVAFNGNDAVELVCGGATIDVIGQIGFDPGAAGWGTTIFTANQTLRRQCSVTTGDANGSDAFDPAGEWTGFAMDTVSDLGVYGCP